MSPRSEELMAAARDGLVAARAALGAGSPRGATSAAYYAMLYAARAALSEEERNARTHTGIWRLFMEAFVDSGRFPRDLFASARRTQPTREAADYDALMVPREQAEEIVVLAERFVSGVEDLLGV